MPKPAEQPRLPSGGEFSPNQIGLGRVLGIVAENEGDHSGAEEALRIQYFSDSAKKRTDPAEQREQQRKRAGNVLVGMRTYGLYKDSKLTEVGRDLLNIADDSPAISSSSIME